MDDGIRGGKLRAASPTAVLDAEDIERERRSAGGNDAVFANDAVLLAAADEFAREEQQRALAAVDQDQLVDGRAATGLRNIHGAAIATANHALGTLLSHSHIAGGETFLEREESTGVLAKGTDDGKNGDVLVGNGIEQPPVPLRSRRRSGRRARC